MDTTIRNLDPRIYRLIKARAVMSGRNVGDLVNEALRGYLNRTAPADKSGTLRQLEPVDFADGNKHLSEEIDALVYGTGAP